MHPGMNGLPAELLLQIVSCLEDAAYFYKVLVVSKEFRKAATQFVWLFSRMQSKFTATGFLAILSSKPGFELGPKDRFC